VSRSPDPRRRGGARKGSPEWLERVRAGTLRGLARRRERLRLRARDLALLRTGQLPVAPAMLPHLEAAEAELYGFLEALGGPDVVSPQRRTICEDVARLGVALRSELQRYAETRDPECASRLSGLVTARRSGLQAAGLERVARDVPDLATYLRDRAAAQERAGRDNGAGSDAQDPPPAEPSAGADSASERGADGADVPAEWEDA